MTHQAVSVAQYREAIVIREVEQALLRLFAQGAIAGTVHTCVGQEFSAVANAGALSPRDFVTSNHRCHGHFISFSKNWRGLLSELLAKRTGVCAGIGSSQHLCAGNFYSNGIQASLAPVACGFALAAKLADTDAIVMSFIGEGTLGEGVLYETFNLAALWDLPLLVVCENNGYSQSTPQQLAVAGDIAARAAAFGIPVMHSNTWDLDGLFANARSACEYVRRERKPLFHIVATYRLNAHSKGDDLRHADELAHYAAIDPIHQFAEREPELYAKVLAEVQRELDEHLSAERDRPEISYHEYTLPDRGVVADTKPVWRPARLDKRRQVHLLVEFFDELLRRDRSALFIGEDVLSPYGGAFKVARGLSDAHPKQVITTPISEAGIVGLGIGLAMTGAKPYVEIMFGDFITLAFDQIVNNASKVFHMYNRKARCPVVVRAAMGGRRGYGPTHSQTLDKFLVGIDNVRVVALNILIDPKQLYSSIHLERHPAIVIENKADYGRKLGSGIPNAFKCWHTDGDYPCVRVAHESRPPDVTIVTYGGMVSEVLASIAELADNHGLICDAFILSSICPLDLSPVLDSLAHTGLLATIEEGSGFAGIGSEIIAAANELMPAAFRSLRIAADPVPIPSVRALESEVLPSKARIVQQVRAFIQHEAVARGPNPTHRSSPMPAGPQAAPNREGLQTC